MRSLTKFLLAGLAAVIPIVGTLWILIFLYKILMRVGDEVITLILKLLNTLSLSNKSVSLDNWNFTGFGLVRFLIPILFLLFVGFIAANQPGKKLFLWLERAMQKVPYLGFIYATLKQFVDALRNLGGKKKFKSVAYVEYPSPGCRLIGFVTGDYYDPQIEKHVTAVFIPTSPNPMTGFSLIVDTDKVQHSDMSLEEAGKMILSAGLVVPVSFQR